MAPRLPLPAPKHRGQLSVLGKLFLLALCIAALLAGSWHASYRARNARAIRRLETTAKQNQEPLTLAELAAIYPPIPDKENAALLFLDLWKKEDPDFWESLSSTGSMPTRSSPTSNPALPFLNPKAPNPSRTKPLPADSLAAAEDHLRARAGHLEAVRLALRRPGWRFPIKIAAGYEALLPHLGMLRSEAEEFRVSGLVSCERGEVAGAIAAITNTVRIGNLLANEPMRSSQLARMACLRMAIEDIERLLSRRELKLAELACLERILDQCKLTGSLRLSYLSERAFALNDASHPAEALSRMDSNQHLEDESDSLDSQITAWALVASGLADAERRLILNTFDTALQRVDSDGPDALLLRKELFEQGAEEAAKFPPKIFSFTAFSLLENLGNRYAILEAHRRAALAAIAVEKFRLAKRGELPDQLAQLVPAYLDRVPLDPFDGLPLRFRKLEHGFVVYSVGADWQDNGGKERPRRRPSEDEYDETFSVER